MRAIAVNGITLHVRDTGPTALADTAAPPLVLSNSLGTDHRLWDRVLPGLAATRRVITYDMRGHGWSSAPAGDYTPDDIIDDLVGLVDALGLERVSLAGLSVGGFVSMGAAAALGDRVTALAACDTGAKIGTAELWDMRIREIRAKGVEAIADHIQERWFPVSFRESHRGEVLLWRHLLTRTPTDGYLGVCAALRDGDISDRLAKITAPSIVITGSQDGSTPPDLGRKTAELIPGATYHQIPGAGHLPAIDTPGAFLAALSTFLEQHGC